MVLNQALQQAVNERIINHNPCDNCRIPKTQNSVRTVAIPQQAVELLVEDRKNHPDSPYLFPSPRTGGMWSPDAIGRLHKSLLRAAGIDEGVRFHDLRHPYVKHKTKNWVNIRHFSLKVLTLLCI